MQSFPMPEASSPDGPLRGVSALDLSRVLTGPFFTMILAEDKRGEMNAKDWAVVTLPHRD